MPDNRTRPPVVMDNVKLRMPVSTGHVVITRIRNPEACNQPDGVTRFNSEHKDLVLFIRRNLRPPEGAVLQPDGAGI